MDQQRGFTLLELLMALTVVSILAVVAVPMYMNYSVRTKIMEGLALSGPVKTMAEDYYQTIGSWPADNKVAGLDDPTSYATDNVDSIALSTTTSGVAIIITYHIAALASNNTLILTPNNVTSSSMSWSCKGGSLPQKYRPNNCRS